MARFWRKARLWGVVFLASSAPLAAQDGGYQQAFEFCVTQTKDPAVRAECIEEWRWSLLRVLEYGQAAGYLDETGALDISEFTGALLDWRTVLGLPLRDPFLRCIERAPVFDRVDYRAVWTCIKRMDPQAAKRDAI